VPLRPHKIIPPVWRFSGVWEFRNKMAERTSNNKTSEYPSTLSEIIRTNGWACAHTHTYKIHAHMREGMTTNWSFQIDKYRLKMINTALELNERLFKGHRWGLGFDHSKGHVGFALGTCKWDGISSPVLRLCLHSNYSNNAPCPNSTTISAI